MSGKRVLLDTNLSVLLVAGLCGPAAIQKHKRLRAYEAVDYQLLTAWLEGAGEIILSPNVVTETSNLLQQTAEPLRSNLLRLLANMIATFNEFYVPSRAVVDDVEYLRLGLTDAVLLKFLSETQARLLTADLKLYLAAIGRGEAAENFSHLREQQPGWQ